MKLKADKSKGNQGNFVLWGWDHERVPAKSSAFLEQRRLRAERGQWRRARGYKLHQEYQ